MLKILSLVVVCAFAVLPGSAQSNGGMAWLGGNRHNLDILAQYIAQSPYLGLQEKDYQPAFIHSLVSDSLLLPTAADTAEAEARINIAAIQFFSNVAFGSLQQSPVSFNGPSYQPSCYNIADSMTAYITTGRFSSFLDAIEPVTPEYLAVKDKIIFFHQRLADSSFRDIRISSFKVDTSNKDLLGRLAQFGLLDSLSADTISSTELATKVGALQRMFNLLPDGTLRSSVTNAFNKPFSYRLRELERALNQIRWLNCNRQQFPAVVVNIPSASLALYQQGKQTLYSRVVVGKRSNRTPTLCSRIKEVVVYPYWTVPYKIATRELLPHIQRNIGYLEANQFDVLDKKGRLVNPRNVPWHQLHPGNFPYVLRQGTGCDNSLGIVKLNFYSPYSVYLHDTPWKSLFMLNQRFFSHGCIRVEDAIPLARLLLTDAAPEMDTLIAKGWVPGQKPVTMPVQSMAYVFVLYNTAWPGADGDVRFYTDEYNLFN